MQTRPYGQEKTRVGRGSAPDLVGSYGSQTPSVIGRPPREARGPPTLTAPSTPVCMPLTIPLILIAQRVYLSSYTSFVSACVTSKLESTKFRAIDSKYCTRSSPLHVKNVGYPFPSISSWFICRVAYQRGCCGNILACNEMFICAFWFVCVPILLCFLGQLSHPLQFLALA